MTAVRQVIVSKLHKDFMLQRLRPWVATRTSVAGAASLSEGSERVVAVE